MPPTNKNWLDSLSFVCFIVVILPWGSIFDSWWGLLLSALALSVQVTLGRISFGAWLPWNWK